MITCHKCQRRMFPEQFNKASIKAGKPICEFCIKAANKDTLHKKHKEEYQTWTLQKNAAKPKKKRKVRQRSEKPKKNPSLPGISFAERNANLKKIGFASYRAYLNSKMWREIRRRVYDEKGRACFLCKEPSENLHHSRYHLDDLTGTTLEYINPVCRECHEEIEFRKGRKVPMTHAKKRTEAIKQEYEAIESFLDQS